MEHPNEVCERVEPSIPIIDEELARLCGELSKISDALNNGVWGNQLKCAKEEDCVAMPTPSLDSIQKKLKDATSYVTDIGKLSKHISS